MKGVVLLFFMIYESEAFITCDNPISNISLTIVARTGYSNTRIKRASQSLRISVHYHNSFHKKDDIIESVINPAIQFWQDALQSKNPLTSPLLIDRHCPQGFYIHKRGGNIVKACVGSCSKKSLCYTTSIPSEYQKKCYTGNSVRYTESGSDGSGAENTDLLILVTQISTGCASSTLAYATTCELNRDNDMPVLGLLNICPGKINTVTGVRQAIAVVKHEIAHILGISANLFAFYRDECGNPRTPRDHNGFPKLGLKTLGTSEIYQYSDSTVVDIDKTYGYKTGRFTKSIPFLVTSTVRNEIRSHFNCSSLEGLMLESYGTSGSALSHFEKLYLQNELMTASISESPRISRLTMAALQDTGWYNVNFDKAEYFDYGKNMGCDFVTQSCFDFMKSRLASSSSILPYCDKFISSVPRCNPEQNDVPYCDLYNNPTQAASTPAQFKYFPDENLVSNNAYSDYCPVMMSTVCNKANLNIDPQCNNADRPCTGIPTFNGTCPPKSASVLKEAFQMATLLCFINIWF